MADTLRFVDSIAASPTTRLNINDDAKWYVRSFDAPPPPLRRSLSNNAMSDGAYVSSSSYDARILTLVVDVVGSSQDDASSEFQKLARELDRETNILQWQPVGASKPVFFRTFRTSMDAVDWWAISSVARQVQVTILAEPFAYGLQETVSLAPGAIGGTTGHADFTPIGDVSAPLKLTVTGTTYAGGMLALTRQTAWTYAKQAESGTAGTDTTNPGGGPDGAMSGTGTNNYLRTSFATTATMATRASVTLLDPAQGTYRVYAAVRRSDNTSVIKIKRSASFTGDADSATVDVPLVASTRMLVPLGLLHAPSFGDLTASLAASSINFAAQRVSGTGTLDWDFFLFVPADVSTLLFGGLGYSTVDAGMVLDADNEAAYGTTLGTLFPGAFASSVGGFPSARPGTTNRVFLYCWTTANQANPVAVTASCTYHPRYLSVRPAST